MLPIALKWVLFHFFNKYDIRYYSERQWELTKFLVYS